MSFKVNDRVKITEDADFGSDHVAKGTLGRINEVYPIGKSYRVRFDGMNRDVTAIESVLAAYP